ncbi:MAG: ABC transporter permease [Bryobacteraceae bacterium]|nr:ABC transporter permease [Bryobacteraceae bacterium]
MGFREILRSSLAALRANRVRTFLTALGLVIGNASVILVVTISLTSTDYILEQIRGLGSNVIWGYYDAGTREADTADADFVKIADIEAIRKQLGDRIVAATGVINTGDRMLIGGREEDVQVIGSDEEYPKVRNLVILAGRFMDREEVALRQKVAMLTEKMAARLFGSQSAAVGRTIKVQSLEFTVIGTFREKTESFGLSELSERTTLIPITVVRYFVRTERIDPFYVQAKRAEDVEPLTAVVRSIIESRHRPGARYFVDNLGSILDAAENIGLILTIVLILVSAIALIISGIGIMNIMLVTVTERTREIGLRMAIGASKRAVTAQFLTEAVLISIAGGMVGILLGLAVPVGARIALDGALDIRISPWSVAVAFAVSFFVGLVFGLLPARRAAQLSPTEALRYE